MRIDGSPDDSIGPNGVAKQPLQSYGTSGGVLDNAEDLVVLGSAGNTKGSYLARIQLRAAVPSLVAIHARRGRLSVILACRGSSETNCTTTLTLKTTSGTTLARKSVTIDGSRRLAFTLTVDGDRRRLLRLSRRLVATLRTGELATRRTLTLG